MKQYQDIWTRYHDKPTDGEKYTSNNGWLYTAYVKKLNENTLNYESLSKCFRQCKQYNTDTGMIVLVRSPYYEGSPISRDEILGMAALGFLRQNHLHGWNFSPYTIPEFSLKELLKQLWKLRPVRTQIEGVYEGKPKYEWKSPHRNFFWKNNLNQIYRFAFSVPLSDRYFIIQKCKFKVNPVARLFYYCVAKIDSIVSTPKNGIHWLKYGGDKRKAIMKKEFPADHPLVTEEFP